MENVIGGLQVDVVLAYQVNESSGALLREWAAALRNTEGRWRKTSGFTTMSGGHGYWVHTPVAETIEVTLSPVANTAPTLRLKWGCNSPTNGWHLVGVWDAEQRPQGTKIDADDYFAYVNWRVVYGFLTGANRWTKQLLDSSGVVETGAGYWVWVSRICGLIP